jgi:hypothetical protein
MACLFDSCKPILAKERNVLKHRRGCQRGKRGDMQAWDFWTFSL